MKAPLVLSAWLGLSAALCGQAPEPATITATGVGKVKVKADMVRISFALSATADTMKEAREKVSAQARKATEGLRQMRLEPEVQQGPGPAEKLVSGFAPVGAPEKFRATHSFVVVVRSAEPEQLRVAASRVLEMGLEQSDGESSSRIQFFKEDDAEAQRKALAAASAAALANAHAIAEGAKVKIADIVSIASREQPRPADSGVGRRTVAADIDIEINCVVEVKCRIQK